MLPSCDLPGDAIESILLNLPIKSLLRFKAVCKPWSFGNYFTFGGLGYVEATNDYKIVRITFDPQSRTSGIGLLWVYTLSTDSWKRLDIDLKKFAFHPRPPVFINGCLHWLTNRHVSGNLIAAFHVAEEAANYMAVPDNYGSRSQICRQLVVIRGSLSLIVFPLSQLELPVIDIWVMAEYGVQESWSNQFRLDALPTIARPIGSWKDGELIFRYDEGASKKVLFYDPSSKRKKYFTEFKAFSFQCFNYIESLQSVEGGRRLPNAN